MILGHLFVDDLPGFDLKSTGACHQSTFEVLSRTIEGSAEMPP